MTSAEFCRPRPQGDRALEGEVKKVREGRQVTGGEKEEKDGELKIYRKREGGERDGEKEGERQKERERK